MHVEKFTSEKATIECRHNVKQGLYRCHVVVGKKRHPLTVRGEQDAADAASKALATALKRKLVDSDDLDMEDGSPVVHPSGAAKAKRAKKHGHAMAKHGKPKRSKHGHAKAKHAAKSKVKHTAKAKPIIGNGEETRALEKEYAQAKRTYHQVGDALKERHEAVAAVAAGG